MRRFLPYLAALLLAAGCSSERTLYQDEWPDITGPSKGEPHVPAVSPDGHRAYTDSLMDASFEEVAR